MTDPRTVCAILTVTEDASSTGTIDCLEREIKKLEQSGISLDNALIMDDDDTSEWARYTNYILNWAFSLPEESPMPYEKWAERVVS